MRRLPQKPQEEKFRMTRQNSATRLIRLTLLLLPGACLLATGTSCGDQLRQSMTDAGTEFVSTAMTTVLEAALTNLLGGSSQT
jgi:hypothetical protein